jgi:hypothetical protein
MFKAGGEGVNETPSPPTTNIPSDRCTCTHTQTHMHTHKHMHAHFHRHTHQYLLEIWRQSSPVSPALGRENCHDLQSLDPVNAIPSAAAAVLNS